MEWVIKLTCVERERRNRTIPMIRTTAIDEKRMSRLRKMNVSRRLVARVGAAAELDDSALRGGLTTVSEVAVFILETVPEEEGGVEGSVRLLGGNSEVKVGAGGG